MLFAFYNLVFDEMSRRESMQTIYVKHEETIQQMYLWRNLSSIRR